MTNITKTLRKKNVVRARRVGRVRSVVSGVEDRPRLAVFRSLKHLSAQIIDDTNGKTIIVAHDIEIDKKLKGIERAAAVGTLVAERAKAKGIKSVVFDRRRYAYHGRVKALAEAVRAAGLVF